MNREQLAQEFKKEYEKLCDKYDMEIDIYDLWNDECYALHIYDRKEKLYFTDTL